MWDTRRKKNNIKLLLNFVNRRQAYEVCFLSRSPDRISAKNRSTKWFRKRKYKGDNDFKSSNACQLRCRKQITQWYKKKKALKALKAEIEEDRRQEELRGIKRKKIRRAELEELRQQRLWEVTEQLAEIERLKNELGEIPTTPEIDYGQTKKRYTNPFKKCCIKRKIKTGREREQEQELEREREQERERERKREREREREQERERERKPIKINDEPTKVTESYSDNYAPKKEKKKGRKKKEKKPKVKKSKPFTKYYDTSEDYETYEPKSEENIKKFKKVKLKRRKPLVKRHSDLLLDDNEEICELTKVKKVKHFKPTVVKKKRHFNFRCNNKKCKNYQCNTDYEKYTKLAAKNLLIAKRYYKIF